mgnify:CR=1 FL=1
MERRVGKKVDAHSVEFKTAIKDYMHKHGLRVVASLQPGEEDQTSDFLKFVYDYDNVILTKEDFQKRKRIKNVVPHCDRCLAKRPNGEQCTRRKSSTCMFCGTHAKGTPHGVLSGETEFQKTTKKIEVWVEEIKGIHYYIDSSGNVYKHDDVLNNKPDPDIIAKWELNAEGVYCIPAYGI